MKVCFSILSLYCIFFLAAASAPPALPVPLNAAPSSTPASSPARRVLVLGSDGLIGSALTSWLHAHNFSTVLVHNRSHVDLREPSALSSYLSSLSIAPSSLSYAFFLACEVGGSKFLQSAATSTREAILLNNLALYRSVLPFLSTHSVPFLFTTSYLSHMDNAYGSIKRVGEQLVSLNPLARSVRLWNVYGRERRGLKAHVLTDWTLQCIERAALTSATDGLEYRQFLHAADVASALGSIMAHHATLEAVTDLSSGQWLQMRDVARVVQSAAGGAGEPCAATFDGAARGDVEESGAVREMIGPNTASAWWRESGWTPKVSLIDGVRDLFAHYGGSAWAERVQRASSRAALSARWNATGGFVYPTDSAPPFVLRSAGAVQTD